jgi:hypothetical protein
MQKKKCERDKERKNENAKRVVVGGWRLWW